MRGFKAARWFSCIIVTLVILFTGIVSVQAVVPKLAAVAPIAQNAAPENALLQFSAGGHILGFKPDKVYFASFDHAVVEEFIGTKGVMPAGEAGTGSTEGMKGAPALGKVVYKNLWQGITLKYEANKSGIAESTYLLEPKAEVKDIKLKYNVVVGIEKDGSLRFRHPSEKGYFSLSAPKAWQEIGGKRTQVEVAFADYGDNTIGFRLGEYNRQCPVVIDPTYQWHTFYGSVAGDDYGSGIAVDTDGNVYVTGGSSATWGAPLHAYSGGVDIVVLKLNSSGVYQWHTFYGSAGADDYDYGSGIAVDTDGNVYVTGGSSATWGAPLHAYSGGVDIVVLKLNSSGVYQWHTFYGSAGANDWGDGGIAVDTGGNVYVTGDSNATWGAPLHAYSGGADIVVLKLNSSGVYQWHTFYGSASADDHGRGIAVDAGGNVYVTGRSDATWGAPLHAYNSHSLSADIVVLKLNSAGVYQWHTFYGSVSRNTRGSGIAVDTSGNVYVTGSYTTESYGQYYDIVVLKLNTSGNYQWMASYGSAGADDLGRGIAVDTGGNVYVTGESSATWDASLNAYSGGVDIVVLKLGVADTFKFNVTLETSGNDIYVKAPIIRYANTSNSTTTYYSAEFVYVPTSDNKIWLKLTKADMLTDIALYSGIMLSELYVGYGSSGLMLELVPIEFNGTLIFAALEYMPTNDGYLWFVITESGTI